MRASYISLLGILLATLSHAQPVTVALEQVGIGLNAPVCLANAGDERMFVVERPGRVLIMYPDGTFEPQPFLDITSLVNSGGGEQGLLGLVFHPNYVNNGYFYVHYTGGVGVGNSRVWRYSVNPADPNDALETSNFNIWSMPQPGPNLNHRGGDIHFGPDGYLYIALGDAGGTGDPNDRAQNLTLPWGKILRLNVDGGSPYAIPATNPYATTGGGVLPEIFMSGLRNPWRFGIDQTNGDVWIGDVGQGAWEEIDFWPGGDNSGPNFGWRCYEGNAPYNTTGCNAFETYDAPATVDDHLDGYCAIIGGRVYRGQQFTRLQGRYLYTDYCTGDFNSLLPDGNGGWTKQTLLSGSTFGVAAFGEDARGELYVCNQGNGRVYRIIDPLAKVNVAVKVFLEGPYDTGTDLMTDALRSGGYVPLSEPFSDLGFPNASWGFEKTTTATLAVTGNNAIVDWIRLELRAQGSPSTIVASTNALVQRDGDVVAIDGVSSVQLIALPGNYHLAVRHRNHLGCMTAGTFALTTTAATIDLRNGTVPLFGTAALKGVGSRQVMWTGNALPDATLKYSGQNNDREVVLTTIGGSVPTNVVSGYRVADVTMDGATKYAGSGNDRDPILTNIGGSVPTNTRLEQLP